MAKFAKPATQAGNVIRAIQGTVLRSVGTARNYEQALTRVAEYTRAQNPANRLATELAYSAGLRAHELHTLRPAAERQADGRPALAEKFQGRAGQRYTVTGKGGLTREVLLPTDLTQRLEAMRLPLPERITDRGIHYSRVYALPGGKNWSSSFSSASRRVLGRSEGERMVWRHSYAQERMRELQRAGIGREQTLETVSQEMGHFRPEITETYLR